MSEEESIKNDLLWLSEEDPEYTVWFSKYKKDTWKSFIDHYAHSKSEALQNKERYIASLKPKSHEFKQEAKDILEYIQQKKLFNLQCLWRAERITLPFVKTCSDFNFWEKYVMECPFLPPVSEDEINLFISFLQSDQYEWPMVGMGWQHYDDFVKYYSEEEDEGYYEDPPEWYIYYDNMVGTAYLSSLPNIREEKELKYTRLFYQKKQEENPAKEYIPDPEMSKEYMFYPFHEQVKEFARAFEDEEDAHAIVAYIVQNQRNKNSYMNSEEVDDDIAYLKGLEEDVELVYDKDWRVAIQKTVMRYRANKIAQFLPGVWRRYYRKTVGDDTLEAYVEKNIANWEFSEEHKDNWEFIGAEDRIEKILQGRELAGEPRNLDF